ncbi:Zinc finger ccch domain-containing protein 10 [Plakobranchus ocellatus]|uniref:Zinc finger ccch domain-containing protein 10 n=1 Tax=Plakobranchus ocellatus TaxID=259542 RepID=A0AAV4DA60_9GAST|nr:Zinc finger ccch domain-containing protein 10 [Plakobranchus ocellatus]
MSNKSDSGSEDTPAISNGSCSGAGSQGRASSMETFEDDVCRDYMRNVCTRGKRCRYRHPPLEERPEQPPPRRDLTFCHDYQNNCCTRLNCKFLHCSRDEQEYFHRTGLLPSRLNHSGPVAGSHGHSMRAETPVCRDYINGDCKRGSKCKYRHESEKPQGHYSVGSNSNNGGNNRHHHDYERRDYGSNSDSKRRRVDEDYGGDGDGPRNDVNGSRPSYSALEDENAVLRHKVAELKKQVSDLTAINEVLLEQNARFRMGKAAVAAAAAAAAGAGVGSIQVSAASQQNIMPAVALAPTVSLAAHAAHSSLTQQLNSSLTQQVALNSDLATQHAIAAQRLASLAQPRVAPPAMTVTPTVTIAQNVAGPMALTQSNMAVSMATMPQLQVAHSLTQNLGAPSTSLVSYPIMSQNMRSAVEPSSHTH